MPRAVSALSATLAVPGLFLAGCAASGTLGGLQSSGNMFPRSDERVLVGSYTIVQAVEVSRRYVFSAGGSGVAILDRLFNRWMRPLAASDLFDASVFGQPVMLMVADPVEDALWIAAPGVVSVYRPGTELLRHTMITGVPDFLALDRSGSGDVIVRSAGQFTRISRIGLTTPLAGLPPLSSLVLPAKLTDLYREYPILRTQVQMFLRQQLPETALGSTSLLSGAASPERSSELWLGTDGDGLLRFDPIFLEAKPFPYGLIEAGVGALAPAADGVWTASLGTSFNSGTGSPMLRGNKARGGLSFASGDLQQFRWIDGTISVPFAGVRSRVLATCGSKAWIGTDRGLMRVRLDGSSEVALWTTLNGLPDNRVTSLAPRDEGTWIGTPRGILFVYDTASVSSPSVREVGERLLDDVAVNALLLRNDTLWVGSDEGLLVIGRPQSHDRVLTRPLPDSISLRRPVRAIAASDSVLLVATDDAVRILYPRLARAEVVDVLSGRKAGQVARVGIDAAAMWVAGSDGALLMSRSGGAVRLLRGGMDIPTPVLDIVATPDWIWLDTPQGLMRLRRTSDGLIP